MEKIVSEKICTGCYWLYETYKGELFCSIVEDLEMDFENKKSCNEKITREEALKKWS